MHVHFLVPKKQVVKSNTFSYITGMKYKRVMREFMTDLKFVSNTMR